MTVAEHVVASLEKAYGATLLPGLRAIYVAGLAKIDAKILPDAAVRAMRKTARRMPSVDEIAAAATEERQARWRGAQAAAKRGAISAATFAAERAARTPEARALARETFALVRSLQGQTITSEEHLATLRRLIAQHPGVGWEEALADAERRQAARAARQTTQTQRRRHPAGAPDAP